VTSEVTPLPNVRFSTASFSRNEGVGPATITVQLSAVSDLVVTVHYTTSNGSALAPNDYAATSGDLTFNPSQTSRNFSVPIVNDGLRESSETVHLALSAPNGANLGTPTSATLTIIDDEDASAPSALIYMPLMRR
jgi:Calx-beta domain